MSAADPALSEHVSAAAHHSRSASKFIGVSVFWQSLRRWAFPPA